MLRVSFVLPSLIKMRREQARAEGAEKRERKDSAIALKVQEEEETVAAEEKKKNPVNSFSHLRPERRQERAPDLSLHFLWEVHPLRCEDGLFVCVVRGEKEKEKRERERNVSSTVFRRFAVEANQSPSSPESAIDLSRRRRLFINHHPSSPRFPLPPSLFFYLLHRAGRVQRVLQDQPGDLPRLGGLLIPSQLRRERREVGRGLRLLEVLERLLGLLAHGRVGALGRDEDIG